MSERDPTPRLSLQLSTRTPASLPASNTASSSSSSSGAAGEASVGRPVCMLTCHSANAALGSSFAWRKMTGDWRQSFYATYQYCVHWLQQLLTRSACSSHTAFKTSTASWPSVEPLAHQPTTPSVQPSHPPPVLLPDLSAATILRTCCRAKAAWTG